MQQRAVRLLVVTLALAAVFAVQLLLPRGGAAVHPELRHVRQEPDLVTPPVAMADADQPASVAAAGTSNAPSAANAPDAPAVASPPPRLPSASLEKPLRVNAARPCSALVPFRAAYAARARRPRYFMMVGFQDNEVGPSVGPANVALVGSYRLLARWLHKRGWTVTQQLALAEVIIMKHDQFALRPSPFSIAFPTGQLPLISSFPVAPTVAEPGAHPGARVCRVQEKYSLMQCLLEKQAREPEAGIADFLPPTYIFPASDTGVAADHAAAFQRLHAQVNEAAVQVVGGSRKWLAKPGRLTKGGEGIEIFDDAASLVRYVSAQRGVPFVAQKLLDNLLLLNGQRFDLRVHAVVTSLEPLVVHWNPQVTVARLSQPAEEDEEVTRETLLTNFTLHKRGDYLWTLANILEHLRARDAGAAAGLGQARGKTLEQLFWQRTVPGIKRALRQALSVDTYHMHRPRSLQVWGCDFLLTSDMRPWFIECNSQPGDFGLQPRLAPRQFRMVEDMFELLHLGARCMRAGNSWDLVIDGSASPME